MTFQEKQAICPGAWTGFCADCRRTCEQEDGKCAYIGRRGWEFVPGGGRAVQGQSPCRDCGRAKECPAYDH